ncbi:aromatic ring-hydroxylating dioxygenase subunit alpha [Pseudomonas sediminis]|uniref:aromatic ring-hydroxylating dioxygenase subunit alpha n=1 Tax=Pseudomonas sediminis TaxID=1691904 RepID=UPI00244CE267|nr:aromatic ring-hydroxylating dioxygenase subunit alpha [Pseudomonas sediminis]MDG9759565.1 aromatic ring-hydroxylating dioxygenase subunit alpha [Pseudomonas sediminis]
MNERYTPERLWRAYRHCWFVVARSCDIDTPQAAQLLDQNLVVFRDAQGVARVTDRRCIHRGADLSAGKVTANGIQCPYHGWAFDGESGQCTEIPALCDGASIPGNAKIRSYPTVERYEHVWTCLEEPMMDIPIPPELDGSQWEWLPAAPIAANCGFMAATENFRDMAHFPFVHQVSMGDVSPLVPKLDVKREGRRLGASFRYERVEDSTFSDIGDAWMHYHSYAPGFAAILYDYDTAGKRYLVDFPTPVSRERCIIHWAVAVDRDFKGGSVADILAIETQVFDEDTPILNGLCPAEVPLAGQWPEASCAADVYTLNYRRATQYVVDHILDRLEAEEQARIAATEL